MLMEPHSHWKKVVVDTLFSIPSSLRKGNKVKGKREDRKQSILIKELAVEWQWLDQIASIQFIAYPPVLGFRLCFLNGIRFFVHELGRT